MTEYFFLFTQIFVGSSKEVQHQLGQFFCSLRFLSAVHKQEWAKTRTRGIAPSFPSEWPCRLRMAGSTARRGQPRRAVASAAGKESHEGSDNIARQQRQARLQWHLRLFLNMTINVNVGGGTCGSFDDEAKQQQRSKGRRGSSGICGFFIYNNQRKCWWGGTCGGFDDEAKQRREASRCVGGGEGQTLGRRATTTKHRSKGRRAVPSAAQGGEPRKL